jgi:hypothetical protein
MSRPPHPPRLYNSNYLAKSTNYKAPRYAAFSTLPSLHPSLVQILSSTPCSQTHSVYVPPLLSENGNAPSLNNYIYNYLREQSLCKKNYYSLSFIEALFTYGHIVLG